MVFRLGDIAGILILLNRLYRTVRRETREAGQSAGFRGGLSKVGAVVVHCAEVVAES